MRFQVDQVALLDRGATSAAGIVAKKGNCHSSAMLCRTVVASLEIGRQIRRNLIVRRGKVGLLLFQLATLRLELGRCSRLRFPKLGKCRGNLLLNCRNLIQLSVARRFA